MLGLNVHPWIECVVAFVLTVVAVAALRPVAYVVDLLDRPSGHKTHQGVVPVVGGLGMFLGIVAGLTARGEPLGQLQHYLFSAALLVVIGMLDDRFGMSPRVRLVVQFLAVLPMYFGAKVRLMSFGGAFGFGRVDLGVLSLAATSVFVVGAINAFNMLDGLDGLAGGIAIVAAVVLVFVLGVSTHSDVALLLAVLLGVLSGFLIFNLPTRWNRPVRCFMGDAGSTLLGFSLAWALLDITQGAHSLVQPVTALWFVIVPVTDLVWTIARRMSRGQSPMHADKEHLHHSMLSGGLGIRAVVLVLTVLSFVSGCIGLGLYHIGFPESLSLALYVSACVLLVMLARYASVLRMLVPVAWWRDPAV